LRGLDVTQFLMQVPVFAVIGAIVYGLSRLLHCRPAPVTLANPRKSSLHALIAVVVSMAVLALLMVRQFVRHGAEAPQHTPIESVRDLIPQMAILVIYGLPAALFLIRNKEGLQTVGITRRNLWQATAIGLLLAAITLSFGKGGPEGLLQRIGPQHALPLVYYAFVGFGEEFLFRGYLQARLMAWLGTGRGWLAASVIMALVHFPHRLLIGGMGPLEALGASAELIPVSLLMGYIMIRVRNIVAPGLFHTFANWVSSIA
jgi:membrane protease YdiL (CAAX protease family)